MSTSTNPVLATFAVFLVLLSCACDPCDDQSGTIEIDPADRTAPDLYWQVTTLTNTPDGPISALRLITDPNTNITMTPNDFVEVTLFAEDNESGVKRMNVQGGFGYTCARPDGAIALSGIIPGDNPAFFNLAEGVCGFAEAAYPSFIIDGANLCVPDHPNLVSGGYQFLGSALNNNDLIRQNFQLTVTIVSPAD